MTLHFRRLGYNLNLETNPKVRCHTHGDRSGLSKPKTSRPHPDHKIYPYRLREITIDRPNQVWAADITYIPMTRGYMFLVAVMVLQSKSLIL